ncbi:kinase-like protein [Hortaea werneckii]|nr:kinase-like protein [Hortaea werneckii]
MPITNKIANQRREEDCIAITSERKYYHAGASFIKRSLRPSEWQVSPVKGTIHVPRQNNERLLNEAATLRFVRQHTSIPVPTVHCCFEDDQAIILVTEYVEGVGMNDLSLSQRRIVQVELESHIQELHNLRSSVLGGPSGIVIIPYRATLKTLKDDWNLKPSNHEEYVFCHNDLSQQNIIVDPQSLKIKAIIDWEYAGFFPESFDMRIFERLGPSVAMDWQEDDSSRLVDFLRAQSVPVVP